MFLLLLAIFYAITCMAIILCYIHTIYNHMRKVKLPFEKNRQNKRDPVHRKVYAQAPGPMPLPILGNLAALGRYESPFIAFTQLSKQYGDIYSLTLGSTRCLVVNNLDLIREVLNQNGKYIGGRPDFLRYNKLFGGDRNNSLALCDWSNLQQKRRNLARRHCSPRDSSTYFTKMSDIGSMEAKEFLQYLSENITTTTTTGEAEPLAVKPLIQRACANMFMRYMCTVRFNYDDCEFQKIVDYFDEIFWEINQGYAVDFLPWLAPFYRKHFAKIINWSTTIRTFILERIVSNKESNPDVDEFENDFTDVLLKTLAENKEVSRDTIIYMLEDFIGGHSAVGNLVMLALTYAAQHPNVAQKIQHEADIISEHGNHAINLYDMEKMPYTLATIFEVLRYSSSPIVPHVASEDLFVADYGVTKGTIVFINNYKLNMSEDYWHEPLQFEPERFLEKVSIAQTDDQIKRRNSEGSDSGVEFERDIQKKSQMQQNLVDPLLTSSSNQDYKIQLKKNLPHFLPFSIGKRTCIGQNLVRGFGFVLLANILQRYDVSFPKDVTVKMNPACVALPTNTFSLIFRDRSVVEN